MDAKKLLSPKGIVGIIIAVISFAVVGISLFINTQDVNAVVGATGIEIKGMFGVSVDFSDINEIMLIEQSMNEIGYGIRTNGSNAFGTLRGQFEGLLIFAKANSSPTIHISRNGDRDIYISLSNGTETRALYNEIIQRRN